MSLEAIRKDLSSLKHLISILFKKVNTLDTEIGNKSSEDVKVKYDVYDPTAGYITDKFVAGGGITLEEGSEADVNKLIITNSAPYNSKPKSIVFKAFLTQSGEYNPNTISNTDLTIGVTYTIRDNNNNNATGFDFTNVGAESNNINTMFIATGTTPNSWGDIGYECILGFDSATPIAIILEDTILNLSFGYDSIGKYFIRTDYKFTLGRTIPSELLVSYIDAEGNKITAQQGSESEIQICTYAADDLETKANDVLNGHIFNIEVFR